MNFFICRKQTRQNFRKIEMYRIDLISFNANMADWFNIAEQKETINW